MLNFFSNPTKRLSKEHKYNQRLFLLTHIVLRQAHIYRLFSSRLFVVDEYVGVLWPELTKIEQIFFIVLFFYVHESIISRQ